ncbi:hypothetical protein M409DRAFT_48879 [Zasmidium cellare ATCC 36951]|uniref:Mid2 domain-containing protein n=1 Tax=Zasmidium cellare ATCC 36951 TaxID=1080233 RepID=A0A6A6D3M2_ZASCE|nr:uncharacterized protein M409DRAFT_48879 [Zasmidium cellare ATCC 36951]KAF2173977.1 hypothetical protein M409DRAFT_48879 [Zasmidium cellare ATCC 36951]
MSAVILHILSDDDNNTSKQQPDSPALIPIMDINNPQSIFTNTLPTGFTTSFTQQQLTTATATPSLTTTAPTPTSTWKSHAPHGYIGAMTGGVLGFLALLVVLGMSLHVWMGRRKQAALVAKSLSRSTTGTMGTMGDVSGEEGGSSDQATPRGVDAVELGEMGARPISHETAGPSHRDTPVERR